MLYLLDTNVCIRLINGTSMAVRRRLESTRQSDVAICSVVKAELFYGAMRSRNPGQTFVRHREFLEPFVSLPFDDEAAISYGQIRADLAAKGTPIGSNDFQIASIALASNLTLITHNTAEFSRVDGLAIEDWEVEA
jgi:tRNA(fMet)-specific endonuclease VapC